VAPSVRSLADQTYPYARQLRLYTDKGRETPGAEAFIKFVRSAAGQRTMDSLGFVTRYQLKLPESGEMP
jgi:ABC-type phosphate transport system substrate-binding protein